MLGRLLVCAVVLGMAAPAFAGEETRPAAASERASYFSADAMPLLLQDERTTWGTSPPLNALAPGFDMRQAIMVVSTRPVPGDIASFDALGSADAAFIFTPMPADPPQTLALAAPGGFGVLPNTRLTPRYKPEPMGGSAYAVNESRSALPRVQPRRRTPLEMMLVLRIDGETSSPPLSFGGGASVLNILPRN